MEEGRRTTRAIGAYGEQLAADFLLRNGFEVIARNFYVRGAELDIVAQKNGVVYFIEVKTRTSGAYGAPESSIHYYKQRHIQYAARIFIASHPRYAEGEMHFSSIAVEVDTVRRRARLRFIQDVV